MNVNQNKFTYVFLGQYKNGKFKMDEIVDVNIHSARENILKTYTQIIWIFEK